MSDSEIKQLIAASLALAQRLEQPTATAAPPTAPAASSAPPPAWDYAAMAKAQAEYAASQRPPVAAAPSAPIAHASLPTQGGVLNPFAMTPQQIKEIGPRAIRESLERLADANRENLGLPPRATKKGR